MFQRRSLQALQNICWLLLPDRKSRTSWTRGINQSSYILDKNISVIVEGAVVMVLNPDLIVSQKCNNSIPELLRLHKIKHYIYKRMHRANSPINKDNLKRYDRLLTEIEFQMQDAWGFPRSTNYHRFWERPRCLCPIMDNQDSYPTSFTYTNQDCPRHGD